MEEVMVTSEFALKRLSFSAVSLLERIPTSRTNFVRQRLAVAECSISVFGKYRD